MTQNEKQSTAESGTHLNSHVSRKPKANLQLQGCNGALAVTTQAEQGPSREAKAVKVSSGRGRNWTLGRGRQVCRVFKGKGSCHTSAFVDLQSGLCQFVLPVRKRRRSALVGFLTACFARAKASASVFLSHSPTSRIGPDSTRPFAKGERQET